MRACECVRPASDCRGGDDGDDNLPPKSCGVRFVRRARVLFLLFCSVCIFFFSHRSETNALASLRRTIKKNVVVIVIIIIIITLLTLIK